MPTLQLQESIERRYALHAGEVNVYFVAKKGSTLLNIPEGDIWCNGKAKKLLRARSLLCFRAARAGRKHGMAAVARRLNISPVAASKPEARRAEIVEKDGVDLA